MAKLNKQINKELNNTWYDDYYKNNIEQNGEYNKQYLQSKYFPLWNKAIQYINKNDNVVDFGCGVGQVAQLIVNNNLNYIYGVDFSEVAIKQAKNNNPTIENKFFVGNLYDKKIFALNTYNCAILFEVLEHIKDDIQILNNIPRNTKIICSVPSFPYKSHVRHFINQSDVIQRYSKYLDIKDIIPIKVPKIIWLINGVKT